MSGIVHRAFVSPTELRNVPPEGHCSIALVAAPGGGFKIFVWNPRSEVADDGERTIAVVNVTTGRWIWDAEQAVDDSANRYSEETLGDILAEIGGALVAVTGNDQCSWHKDAADGAADTATGETPFYYAETARTIAGIKIIPAAALTAHATNNATITVYKRSSDGQTQTTIASMITTSGGSGSWTAWVEEAFASLSETDLAAGEFLTVAITKGASGVAVPALEMVVEFSEPRLRSASTFLKDAADAAASTATAVKAIGWTMVRRVMASIKFIPAAAVTANASHYATMTVHRRDSAGANATSVAAKTTETTSWTAFTPVDFGALSVTEMLPGEQLTVTIAKTGDGVALPIGLLVVTYSEPKLRTPAEWHKDAADAAAATTTAEKAFYRNTSGIRRRISAIKFVPAANLTSDASHYATLTVARRAAGGGSATTLATLVTTVIGGGSWTAHVPVELDYLGALTLDDDEILTVAISKTGNGVAVPAGQLVVEFEGVETGAVSALRGRVQKRSLTADHSTITAAAGSEVIAIGTPLPPNSRIIGVSIHTVTAFSGGTIGDFTVDIGSTGDADAIVDGANLFAAAVDGQAATLPAGIAPNKLFASGVQLNATFICGTDDVADATAGACTIDVLFEVLP